MPGDREESEGASRRLQTSDGSLQLRVNAIIVRKLHTTTGVTRQLGTLHPCCCEGVPSRGTDPEQEPDSCGSGTASGQNC